MKTIGDTDVYEGMKAKFTACASGYPQPDVEWFRNGDRIYADDRIKIDTEPNGLLRLTITDVTVADVGKYSCRIYNPHGDDICHAELIYESMFNEEIKPLQFII